MHGITIIYEYSGDDAHWREVTGAFVAAAKADAEIGDRFHYRVQSAKEGNRKVHWGWWDKPETVQTLQSRDYFKTFAGQLQEMAGDSLSTIPISLDHETG